MTSRTVTSSSTSYRSSSGGGIEGEDQHSTYRPKCTTKSVIVQRGGGGYGRSRSSMYGGVGGSGTFSSRISASFSPQIYSQMAGSGIADFRGTREKEKREIQDCNERLATYIEKVRWLEAQNKQLEAENEALRKRKQEDWRPIKEAFEGELQQAREVIKELSTQKGVSEAKLAGLQDEIDSLKDLIGEYENQAKDYCKKIDQLNSQLGDNEGELHTLRLRCGSLEDEAAKLRALVTKYKDENARLRADLDAETAAHIEQEVCAQTKTEEVEFLQELLDRLQLTQQDQVTVKGVDMETFFKGELRQAIMGMQQMYDEKVDQISMDYDAKVQSHVNQLRSGNVRDTMEAEHAKSEIKRVRDQLAERNARIAQLESELAIARADRDRATAMLSEVQMELESLKADHARKMHELQAQVEALMCQLNELIDAKMSLELEIACYKKLLEGEENRTGLRQLVEQTIGMRGGGAGQIADIIGGGGQSSKGGEGSGGSSTARMEIQKTRTGFLGIKQVESTGGSVELELDGSARSGQDLQGLRLIKRVNGNETFAIDLGQCELGRLEPGRSLCIYATGKKNKADNKFEHISNQFSFGVGPCEMTVEDNKGKKLATLTMRQTY